MELLMNKETRKRKMKRLIKIIVAVTLLICMAGCGTKYECSRCDASTREAYYDMSGNYICTDCAREYWVPLSYKNYKVE